MQPPEAHRRLPAEWEPQSAVMLTWPQADSGWGAAIESVETVFLSLAAAVLQRQHLVIGFPNRNTARRITERLTRDTLGRLFTAVVPSNDCWARDHGPISIVEDGEPRLLNFRFNGWGGKYAWQADDAVTRALAGDGLFGDTELRSIDLVLEGGSIDSDGQGTLLTTASCLLHPSRNPGWFRERLEARLGKLLGAERVLWLEHGALEGDDTDGHIDMLARFTDPHTIVYQSCNDPDYRHYATLGAMREQLQGFRTVDGTPYRLLPLPWPGAHYDESGRRLPASYANFLIINGAVLLPVYGNANDRKAAQLLQQALPEREIVPIDCLPLIRQHGSLHCTTMQLPAGVHLPALNDANNKDDRETG